MGNSESLPLDLCSTFSTEEISRLAKRFKKLDTDSSGSISVEEFMSLPELGQNPLVQRVVGKSTWKLGSFEDVVVYFRHLR